MSKNLPVWLGWTMYVVLMLAYAANLATPEGREYLRIVAQLIQLLLAHDARDLARMGETEYRPELASASVRRKWFPTRDGASRAIDHQLSAFLRLTTSATINIERERRGCRSWQLPECPLRRSSRS